MHPGAFEFISRHATQDAIKVIEVGSRDINGSVRPLFPGADYTGIDLIDGPGVDWVGDALDYMPTACTDSGYWPKTYVDVVVIAEVLEHCPHWQQLVKHAWLWLDEGGKLIITCGGEGRDPHSAIDGGPLRDGEHYANISASELRKCLLEAGFEDITIETNEHWKDTYAVAYA